MKADEMALECAKQLKAYCEQQECADCEFARTAEKHIFLSCELDHKSPCQWELGECDMDLNKLYEDNEDFKNYIDKFCKEYGISKEKAFTHKVIIEDIATMYAKQK